MSMVVYAASMCLQQVMGNSAVIADATNGQQVAGIYWWIAGVGLFAAIYTCMGGIQAMIWTDVLQCLLLLAGVLMAIGFVAYLDGTGPIDWWKTVAAHAPKHTSPPLFTPDVMVRNSIVWVLLGNFFWTVCTHGSDQVVLQRYFSTPSLSAARRSYFTNVGVDLTMSILLAIAGLALLAFYLRQPDRLPEGLTAINAADRLLPYFLGHELPPGCAGLIMSAFICDAIQTLESGVNAITAVVTNDVVPRLRHGRPRLLSDLAFARLMTLAVTLIVTTSACFVADRAMARHLTLVDMMPKFFNMFVGPLAALFFTGMFCSRCTSRSAIPALCGGLAVSVVWSWYPEIFDKKAGPTVFLAIAVPCLTTIGTAFVLSFVVERGGPHAGQDFTWFAIVRGGQPAQRGGETHT
jgi:SSS family solute:Na+ symporter